MLYLERRIKILLKLALLKKIIPDQRKRIILPPQQHLYFPTYEDYCQRKSKEPQLLSKCHHSLYLIKIRINTCYVSYCRCACAKRSSSNHFLSKCAFNVHLNKYKHDIQLCQCSYSITFPTKKEEQPPFCSSSVLAGKTIS